MSPAFSKIYDVWRITHRFKKAFTLSGFSVAAENSCFYISDYDIMLDGGLQAQFCPEHIFITHTHADHWSRVAYTILFRPIGGPVPNLYVPFGEKKRFQKYLNALLQLSSSNDNTVFSKEFVKIIEMKPGDKLDIICKKQRIQVHVFKTDHTTENSIGFAFSKYVNKLKPKYQKLVKQKPKEFSEIIKQSKFAEKEILKHLKKAGLNKKLSKLWEQIEDLEITLSESEQKKSDLLKSLNDKFVKTQKKALLCEVDSNPLYSHLSQSELAKLLTENKITHSVLKSDFVYTGDTRPTIFDSNDVDWKAFKIIITECTYIKELSPNVNVVQLGKKNGHTIFNGIKPFVEKFSDVTFVLCHWSARYKMKDVDNFFNEMGLDNVFPWTNGMLMK